jgi:Ribbon-helix-helix protein, copG family
MHADCARTTTATAPAWRTCSGTYGSVYGMEKTTVYLTEAQKRALERVAKASGRSEAELIREGVELVAAQHGVAEPTLPLFESHLPDLAEAVDEALDGFGER